MNRRRFVIGLGALVGGGSAALGTGAFSNVAADRTAAVEVAQEDQAYLTLTQTPYNNGDNPNGQFASASSVGGKLNLDFNDEIDDVVNEAGGSGVAADSTYVFDDVFRVGNQGTQEVYVDASPIPNLSLDNGGTVTMEFFARDNSEELQVIDGSNAELAVPTGKKRGVGVRITTDDVSNYDIDSSTAIDSGSDTTTIVADSTQNADMILGN